MESIRGFDSRPRLKSSLASVGQRVLIPRAGSIDSLTPASSVAAATFVYVARIPPAPFPPPPLFIGKNAKKSPRKAKVRHSPAVLTMFKAQPIYEVRSRKDRRGFDLISDALPFGAL